MQIGGLPAGLPLKGGTMAKRKNYGFEKRQLEMAKKKKQEEKRARKQEKKDVPEKDTTEQPPQD